MNAKNVYASSMMESLQRAADAIGPQMEVFARAVELAGQSVAFDSFERIAELWGTAAAQASLTGPAIDGVAGPHESMESLLLRPDLNEYIDSSVEAELAFADIVSGIEEDGVLREADEFDVLRLGLRDADGKLYRSVSAAGAILCGVGSWWLNAVIDGDLSPVAALVIAIAVYRGLRRLE